MDLTNTLCVCGSGKYYGQCCGPFHGGFAAPTAALLMRSRYSAYVLALPNYLRATWHVNTCPSVQAVLIDVETKWQSLTIVNSAEVDERHAVVEFIARYKWRGRAQRLHEISCFVREENKWFYVDGSFPEKL